MWKLPWENVTEGNEAGAGAAAGLGGIPKGWSTAFSFGVDVSEATSGGWRRHVPIDDAPAVLGARESGRFLGPIALSGGPTLYLGSYNTR